MLKMQERKYKTLFKKDRTMKNILGTIFFTGVLFFGSVPLIAMAGENSQETVNSGFGAYFVETGHPGFDDHAQQPLLAYDSFSPSDLDNIEPASGTETEMDTTDTSEASNHKTGESVKE